MPTGIAHKIATNSSSEEIFKQAEPPYKEALKQSKFTDEAIENGWKYSVKDPKKAKKRKKGRNLTFFTPPFCAAVKTRPM